MTTQKIAKLLELLGSLPIEKQREIYFMVLGAIAVSKSRED